MHLTLMVNHGTPVGMFVVHFLYPKPDGNHRIRQRANLGPSIANLDSVARIIENVRAPDE
jgi:hypothetical protein